MQKFDITVVGMGMVGCATAALLAKSGFKVALADAKEPPEWTADEPSGQVSALNIASIRILKFLGVWDQITLSVRMYSGMDVWDRNSPAQIEFSAQTVNQPALGAIVHNNLVTHTLLEKLEQNFSVTVLKSHTLHSMDTRSEGVNLDFGSANSLTTKLVVGADGKNSTVKSLAGISDSTERFDQDAITAAIEFDSPAENIAYQCFLNTGPVALLPMPSGQFSLVWSLDSDQMPEHLNASDEDFIQELEAVFSPKLGSIKGISSRATFPLVSVHADTYLASRVALVGDAAHAIHPLAGLGANIGFLDAACLAQELDRAHRRDQDISRHTVLRRYERWRKGENENIRQLMKWFKEGFGTTNEIVSAIRSTGMNTIDNLPPVKQLLVRAACGIDGDLPEICRSPNDGSVFGRW
ncbi:MAG: FAD-dependent oxidoreductase [Pseudomonadota bacterium]